MFNLTSDERESIVAVQDFLNKQTVISADVYHNSDSANCREFQLQKIQQLTVSMNVLNLFSDLGEVQVAGDFPYQYPTDLPEDIFKKGIYGIIAMITGYYYKLFEEGKLVIPNKDNIKKYKPFYQAVVKWANNLGFQVEPWLYRI